MTSITCYVADNGRCGARLRWPAEILRDRGADVRIVTPGADDSEQLQGRVAKAPDGTEVLLNLDRVDSDVVVWQRPLKSVQLASIPMLQAQSVKVVVEIDDDFSCIHPNNHAWGAAHPKQNPDRNFHHLAKACALADLVTVTTPALAQRYGRHGRVVVIENHIPASYIAIEGDRDERVRVGWSGQVATHPGDLQITRGAVARALGSAVFRSVGDGIGVAERLGIPEIEVTGYLTLDEYPKGVASLDIGIVPLEDSAFNHAKSGLKALEYASLGVVGVASPTPDNLRLHEDHGIGFIASKPKAWERIIRRLINDADERTEKAAHDRAAAEHLTIEANAHEWLSAWTT